MHKKLGIIVKTIKKIIKQTNLYKRFDQSQIKKKAVQWTVSDQNSYDFYSQFISEGDVCFDIGANNGNRTKIFLKMNAKVIAVEPQEKCIKILKELYQHNINFTLLEKVLGAFEGKAEMLMSDADTLSSMSTEWINAVKQSGRFSDFTWDKKVNVQMTTLDSLIEEYGKPAFVKIDVEGFEYEVIKGLTQPVSILSLEFTPEHMEPTFNCFDYLESLGQISLNYSLKETMSLVLDDWISNKDMVEILSDYKNSKDIFGDVYIKFV